jgi:hypothetical protein
MSGITLPKRYSGICEPTQRKDMVTSDRKSCQLI